MEKVILIGWDVGGWLGKKNAICVMEVEGGAIKIFDDPKIVTRFQLFKKNHHAFLGYLDQESKVILAVDSPLGFPHAFVDLINEADHNFSLSKIGENDIDNKYGFRETDVFISRHFKKPLSPTFSMLTSNITLALNVCQTIKSDFAILKEDWITSYANIAIEVYPFATLNANLDENMIKGYKDDSKIRRNILKEIKKKYPLELSISIVKKIIESDDKFDAFICCLGAYDFLKGWCYHPNESKANSVTLKKEGWIWAKDREKVK